MATRLSREELILLVKKIVDPTVDEETRADLLDQFSMNTAHPASSDLIFYPTKDGSIEDIVDEALNYKPIILS